MRLRDCTPYVSCSQGNRHRFIFKLEEIIWWLAGNNVTCTSQVALMVWWRNNRRSLKKIYDTGIGIARFSLRKKPMSDMEKKNIHDRFGPARVKNGKHMISKMVENRGNYAVFILIGPNRPLVIFLLSLSLAALWKRAFY